MTTRRMYYEWFVVFMWIGFGVASFYNRETTNMLVCLCLSKLSMIRIELAILKETLERQNVR